MSNIEYQRVSFSYDKDRRVLDDISFKIQNKESVGIIGANGAGKTTLFRLMLGLEKADSGRILINDMDVKKENYAEIRKKIGYVFQDSDNQLFMNTVADELSFGLYNYGLEENEIQEKIDKILEKLDIVSLKDRKIIKLSGGEKKLVSIASILVMEPEVLLLDEPTNALDPRYRRRVIEILNEIERTKIIASHDLDMIAKTCGKVILVYEGKVVEIGETQEILSNQEMLLRYGLC